VDGASEAEGALVRWKKMGGNEIGNDVRLEMVTVSEGRGPAGVDDDGG
jgi:hypothetical protein